MATSIGVEQAAGQARPALAAHTHLPGGRAADCAAVAVLLAVIGLSLADGLISGTVAAERDTAIFYFPLMAWTWSQLDQGQLPLWLPHIFGGYPIFADGELGLAYPPVLLALLAFSANHAFVLLRFIHLGIAAIGCFTLARIWGLPPTAATLAGIVFALGSFLQAQLHHENLIRSAVWLPLTLVFAEQALRNSGGARLRWVLLASLVFGFAGLGLHPQALAINIIATALYGAFRAWEGPIHGAGQSALRRTRTIASTFLGLGALGLALATIQLVPLLELAQWSLRGSGLQYQKAAEYSLHPLALLQLIFPFFFRNVDGQYWGIWVHWETSLYVGLAPLLLASLAVFFVRRRDVLGWTVLALGGLLMAFGQYSPVNLHYLFWLMPGAAELRAPGRFTILSVLALAMLAAHGLAWLQSPAIGQHNQSSDRGLRRFLAAIVALPLLLAALLGGMHFILQAWPQTARATLEGFYLSLQPERADVLARRAYGGFLWATNLANTRIAGPLVALFTIACCLLLWQLKPRSALRRWPGWPMLVVLVTAADLLLFSRAIHPRQSLASLTPTHPAAAAIRAHGSADQDGQPYRVLASPDIPQLSPNRLVADGLEDVRGYSSLESAWINAYLERILRGDDQLLDLFNIRYIVEAAGTSGRPRASQIESRAATMAPPFQGQVGKYPELYRDDEVVVLENTTAYPRAFVVPSVRTVTQPQDALQAMDESFEPALEAVVVDHRSPAQASQTVPQSQGWDVKAGARVERYELHRVDVRVATPTDAFLVLLDSYYPGWQAFVDGEKQTLLRGNLLFRVVQVPAGVHTVEFRFHPASLLLGAQVSTLALTVVVAGLALSLWLGRSRGETPRDRTLDQLG